MAQDDFLGSSLMFDPSGSADLEARLAEMQSRQVNDGAPNPQPTGGLMPEKVKAAAPSAPKQPAQVEPAPGSTSTSAKEEKKPHPNPLLADEETWQGFVQEHEDKKFRRWTEKTGGEYPKLYQERTAQLDQEVLARNAEENTWTDWALQGALQVANPVEAVKNALRMGGAFTWTQEDAVQHKKETVDAAQEQFKLGLARAKNERVQLEDVISHPFIQREIQGAKRMYGDGTPEYQRWFENKKKNWVMGQTGFDPTTGKPDQGAGAVLRQGFDMMTPDALVPPSLVQTPAGLFEKAQRAQKAPLATMSATESAINGFTSSLVSMAPEAVKSISAITEGLTGDMDGPSRTRLAMDNVIAKIREAYPSDPARAEEYVQNIGQGAGTMTGFLLGQHYLQAMGIARTPALVGLGASQNVSQALEKAEELGANTWQKYMAMFGGFALGATEALPIERFLYRAENYTGGLVQHMLRQTAASSGEEFLQEFIQTVGDDAMREILGYDPGALNGQSLLEGLKSGTIGAAIGGIMGPGASLASYNGAEQKLFTQDIDVNNLTPEQQTALQLGQTDYERMQQAKIDQTSAEFDQLFPDTATTVLEGTDAETEALPQDPLASVVTPEPEVDPVTGEASAIIAPEVMQAAIDNAGRGETPAVPEERAVENQRKLAGYRQKWADPNKPSPGAPKNERTVIQPPPGSNLPPVVVGEMTFDDWQQRTESLMTPEDIEAARTWYEDVRGVFRSNIPDQNIADQFMVAWLAAQQNIGVDGALNNVLLQAEQYARQVAPDAMKAGGMPNPTDAIRKILTGQQITEGMGRKIYDFIDSAFGKTERGWMGANPEGGSPFVVDIHTARDTGLVDQIYLNHLQRLGYQVPSGLQLDHGGTPAEASYENRAQWGRDLTDHLNSQNWMGKNDWKPHEVQAVGWMGMLKLAREAADNTGTAFDLNKRNISFEAKPGTDTDWQVRFGPRWDALPYEQQQAINDKVTTRAWEIAERMSGIAINYGAVNAKGGYMGSTAPSTVAETASTADAAEIAARTLGYILKQDEVWSNKVKGFTKNPKAIAIDIIPQVEGFTQDQIIEAFDIAMREGPKVKGAPLIVGFQPISGPKGTGIRMLYKGGTKSVETVREFAEQQLGAMIPDGLNVYTGEAEITAVGNDWKKDPKGNGYIQGLIQKLGRDPRAELDSAAAELQELFEQGLDEASQTPAVSGSFGPRAGGRRAGTSPKLRKDGKVELTHWNKTDRPVLDPRAASAESDPAYTPQSHWREDGDWVPRLYFGVDATTWTSLPRAKQVEIENQFRTTPQEFIEALSNDWPGEVKQGKQYTELRITNPETGGDVMLLVQPGKEGSVQLTNITAETTGQGDGTYAMQKFIELVDKYGQEVRLLATQVSKVPNEKLMEYYEGFGFFRGMKAPSKMDRPAKEISSEGKGGYVREAGLGSYRHTVALNPEDLYNWAEDPMGFSGKVTREGMAAVREMERMIYQAGFKGIYYPSSQLGQTAILFEAIEPESVFLEPARRTEAKPGEGRWIKEPPPGTPLPTNFHAPRPSTYDQNSVMQAPNVSAMAFGQKGVPQTTATGGGGGPLLGQGVTNKMGGEMQQDPRMGPMLPGNLSRPAAGIDMAQGQSPADINRQKIVKAIQKIFDDMSIRQGIRREGFGGALGIFDNMQGNMRLAKMDDVETLVHEVGHKIHREFQWQNKKVRDWMIKWHKDLKEIALLTYQDPNTAQKGDAFQLSEGFAEFFRLYVINPNYITTALKGDPAMIDEFKAALDPKTAQGFDKVGAMYRDLMRMPSAHRIQSQMVSQRRLSQWQAASAVFKEEGLRGSIHAGFSALGGAATSLYTSSMDKDNPMAVLVDKLQQVSKKYAGKYVDLKRADDPYVLQRMLQNTNSVSLSDIKRGVTRYRDGHRMSAGLTDVLMLAHGQDPSKTILGSQNAAMNPEVMREFSSYLIALRAKEEFQRYFNGEIRNPPLGMDITEGDVIKTIEEMEAKHGQNFISAAQELYAYNNALLLKMYEGNLISKEDYEKYSQMKNYVPLMRDMSDRQNILPENMRQTGLAKIHKFGGSGRAVIDPIEVIMMRTFSVNQAIHKNDIVLKLAQLASGVGYGAGEFVEHVPATKIEAMKVGTKEILKALRDKFEDPDMTEEEAFDIWGTLEGMVDNTTQLAFFRRGEAMAAGENLLFYMQNGKQKAIILRDAEVGRDVVDMMTAYKHDRLPPLIDAIATTPATMVRTMITKWADFLFINFIRDQVMAFGVSDVGYIPFFSGARGIKNELSQDQISQMASSTGMAFGGASTSALSSAQFDHDVRALKARGYIAEVFTPGNNRNMVSNAMRGFAKVTELTETATRLGLWKLYYQRALNEGLTPYEAAMEASYEATDYIDFGRRGANGPLGVLRRTIPFLNAQLQGLDKMIRVMGMDEFGRVEGINGALKAYAQFMKDPSAFTNDRIQQRAIERGRKFMVKFMAIGAFGALLSMAFKDDEEYQEVNDDMRRRYWVIPIGPGRVFMIPKPFELAAMSNYFEYQVEKYYNEIPEDRNIAGETAMDMIPPMIPTIMGLPLELIQNRSLFTGREISPHYMQSLPPHMRYTAYTGETAKKIAEITGWDAMMVDYFISGLTASAGRDIQMMINSSVRENGKTNDFTDYPVLRRLYRDTNRGNKATQQFWDLVSQTDGKLRQAERGYKTFMDQGNPAAAEAFLDMVETDDEKVYALLNTHGDVSAKRLHPLRRARDIASVVSGMSREINSEIGLRDTEFGEPLVLTPNQKAAVDSALRDISRREIRNAMVFTRQPGWAGKSESDVDSSMRVLEELSPDIYAEFIKRMRKVKVYTNESVRELWPDLRDRLLNDGPDAQLDDLAKAAQQL